MRDLLRPIWRRSRYARFARSCTPTKPRKIDSRYVFRATAGQQKRRREGAGLDQIGSSRHG